MPTALITGGSAGLGAAFAHRLAADGYDLVLVARNRARLDSVAADLRTAYGIGVEVLVADLTRPAMRTAVERRLDGHADAPVALLVNNAGMSVHTSVGCATPAALQSEIDLNVTAVLQLTRAALPAMLDRGHGAVINVASFAGYLGEAGSAYSASKAWVLAFTDRLAASTAGTGVRVIALCPGRIRAADVGHAGPTGRRRTGPSLWLEPTDVVDRCLADLRRGRALSVPGGVYRSVVNLLELPRRSLRAAYRLAAVVAERLFDVGSGGHCRFPHHNRAPTGVAVADRPVRLGSR